MSTALAVNVYWVLTVFVDEIVFDRRNILDFDLRLEFIKTTRHFDLSKLLWFWNFVDGWNFVNGLDPVDECHLVRLVRRKIMIVG